MRSMIMVAGSVTLVGIRAFFSAQGPGLSSKCSKEVLSILKVLKRGSGQATCVSCVKVLSPVLFYARMHEL